MTNGFETLSNYYAGKRVLVTGSTGFKGSWLCHMLAMLGAEVTGYALEPPTVPSLFNEAEIGRDVCQEIGDIRDRQHLAQTFLKTQPHVVFHLAAQPLVITSYEQPAYTYETNVMGTVNVLECVRITKSVRSFLNVTTDKVYENLEKPRYGYKEDDKLDGFDPYSNSKSCSELVTHSYARSFFASNGWGEDAGRCAISTARAGNVIGGGDFADNRIIPDCVRAALSGKTLNLRNPNSVRPYQHVLEPLSAYLSIAMAQEKEPEKAGWYNIGPDEFDCLTTGVLVELFKESWGEGFAWSSDAVTGPHEANFLMLDNNKVKQELGWIPTWRTGDAVRRTVEWTRIWDRGNVNDTRAVMDRQVLDYLEGIR